MAHFAELDADGTVIRVLVIEQDMVDTGRWGDPASFVQTSYNTYGGVHKTGGVPLRKNYAGIGYSYDKARDAFIPPKPFASWLLDEAKAQWAAPKPEPKDGQRYVWDEIVQNWRVVK